MEAAAAMDVAPLLKQVKESILLMYAPAEPPL
jgi:hypothetical protein